MHKLKDVHTKILDCVFTNTTPPHFVQSTQEISKEERISVHRTTIIENLASSLKIDFPGIWQLIGEDCARSSAIQYSYDMQNLSLQNNLFDFGKNFPDFLKTFQSTKNIPYLSDYAKFEYLKNKSYYTINFKTIAEQDLLQEFAKNVDTLSLKLNPSIYLLHSVYPILDIEELLLNKNAKNITINQQDHYIIICRVNGIVNAFEISKLYFEFIKKIQNQKTISCALDYLAEQDATDELTNILKLMLNKNMIIGTCNDKN